MNWKLKYLVLILSLLIVQCTSEQKSWENAKLTNTPSAYEGFLTKYSESAYSDSAQMILEELVFKEAQATDSLPLLKAFIDTYPQSQFADSAQFLVEKIYFDQAKSVNTKNGYKDFLKQYPASDFAKEAKRCINNMWTIKELSYSIMTEISGSGAPDARLLKKAETGCIIEISGLFILPASRNATIKLKDIRLSGESSDNDKKMTWEMAPIGQGFKGNKGFCSYHFMDHMVKGAVTIQSLSGDGFELAKDFAEDPGMIKILGRELQLCLAFAVPKMPKSPFILKFGYNTVTIE